MLKWQGELGRQRGEKEEREKKKRERRKKMETKILKLQRERLVEYKVEGWEKRIKIYHLQLLIPYDGCDEYIRLKYTNKLDTFGKRIIK